MPALRNPFTPSEIASSPNDFFGRSAERRELQAALLTGSAAIQGAIGIGKSSLLAQTRLQCEGFGSASKASSIIVTCHKEMETIDQLAQAVLEELVEIDEMERSYKFKVGSFFETGSKEVVRNFNEGRHLAALQRLLSKASLRSEEMLLIALDEVDKCPKPVAQLIRAVTNQAQQNGIKNVRFLLAGVAPYYDQMLQEDSGVSRFVYRVITLEPMSDEDAADLLETKLDLVALESSLAGEYLEVQKDIVPRTRALAGGHPHLLQLLGSHLIEQENNDPDGRLDAKNLTGALNKICYEDRGQIYDSTLHMLHVEGRFNDFTRLLTLAGHQFPTRIDRTIAGKIASTDALRWFVDRSVLSIADAEQYGLVDEFLRIRIILDSEQLRENRLQLESSILKETRFSENFDDSEFDRAHFSENQDPDRIAYIDEDELYIDPGDDEAN